MNRLTEHDDQGNWCLKGVAWNMLHVGQVITKEIWEKLYGALWKLKDYEDTGLTPEDVERVNDFERSETGKLLKVLGEERKKHAWIPVTEQLPESDDFVLLSFANFSLPMIGRYERDEDGGGAWYVGDCDEEDTCAANDLFVIAWMPLPEAYRKEEA